MMTSTYFSGSCAASGITNLGDNTDAFSAMKAFCVRELADGGRYSSSLPQLTAYYAFVAGPEVSGKGHSKRWVKYGTEFAAYIRSHKLGDVATVGPKKNLKFHSDTTCQIWVWSPDQKAVETWWRENKNRDKEAPSEVPKSEVEVGPKPGNQTCTACKRENVSICCDGKIRARWCSECCKCHCHKRERV